MGNGITRAGVTAAQSLAIADIEPALAACDPDRAAEIAVARLAAGDPLGPAIVRALVPQLLDVPVACALMGSLAKPDRAALVDLIERFPDFADALPLQVMVLWAAWRAGAEVKALVIPARRLARRKLDKTERALLGYLGAAVADPGLLALTKKLKASEAVTKPLVVEADRLLAMPVAQVIAELPAAVDAAKSLGFTVRAAAKVGRNEPCPCGSGKKYKKCCEEKDSAVASSPVAGMSWDAYLSEGAATMSDEDVKALSMFDLARVDKTKLPKAGLEVAFRRFARELYWDKAIAVLDELGRRDGLAPADLDALRDELLAFALARGEVAVAQAMGRAITQPDPLREVELGLMTGTADAVARAIDFADAMVARGDGVDVVDFALALMKAKPALGLLVARGCVGPEHADDLDLLMEGIENARDVLDLPPGDPVWDRVGDLIEGGDAEKAEKAAARAKAKAERSKAESVVLHGSLRDATARVAQLERELAAKQAELDARGRAGEGAVAEPAVVKELRRKVEELEGLVREGVAERAELRRQLATAPAVAAPAAAAAAPASAADDPDEGDELDVTTRDIAIPQYSRRVLDALDDVPRAVAAEALRTIGALAAGDLAAWRRAKTARDMARQVLMARVGIHHRLIFRAEDGPLEIIDLITREELLTTLKKLRATKG